MFIPALASCFLAGILLVWWIDWISLGQWRKSAGQHWAERARILWPARKTSAMLLLFVPLILSSAVASVWTVEGWQRMSCWLAATAGSVLGNWFMTRELFPEVSFRSWLHEVAVGWLLRLGLWAILLAIGFTMPGEFNRHVWLAFSGAVLLKLVWPTLSLRLLRLSGILRPAEPRLLRLVSACEQEGSNRVREVYQLKSIMANAMALPMTGTLLFFDRLLEILSDEEVIAICAHEIGHLAESKWIAACRYLGTMAVLPALLIHPLWVRFGMLGVYGALLMVILWSRMSRKLTRRMEGHADAFALDRTSGSDVYARALERLYEANQVAAVLPGNNGTHPHLYDRMLQCGVTPGFPRPAAPEKFTAIGWLLMVLGPFLIAWLVLSETERDRERTAPGHREGVKQVPPRQR